MSITSPRSSYRKIARRLKLIELLFHLVIQMLVHLLLFS